MRKPESVLETETNIILWNFTIQTDHLIPARRPDLVIKKKERKRELVVLLTFPFQWISEWKSEKTNERQLFRSCQRTKKAVEHEDDSDTIVIDALDVVPKGLERSLEELVIEGQA